MGGLRWLCDEPIRWAVGERPRSRHPFAEGTPPDPESIGKLQAQPLVGYAYVLNVWGI
jgi:hypothetical protein